MEIPTVRWFLNGQQHLLYAFNNEALPLSVTLNPPIPGVTIEITEARQDINTIYPAIISVMTTNTAALGKANITSIYCGSLAVGSNAITFTISGKKS